MCPPGVSFVNQFADCFAKCKAAGLKVLVTMSHLVPYSCQTGSGQGMDLVNEWIQDSNIDYISPQLYTQGDTLETADLSIFKNAKAKIVPSIPYDFNWPDIQSLGITPAGYISWSRLPFYCGTDSTDASNNCKTTSRCLKDTDCGGSKKCYNQIMCNPQGYCGTDWTDAKNKCCSKCNGDGDCPSDSPHCILNVPCNGINPNCKEKVNLCGLNWNTVDCATSVRCPGGTNGECPPGQQCFGNNSC